MEQKDLTNQSHMLDQIGAYRNAASALQKEAFKAETVLDMMNNCADNCKLTYFESGIHNEEPATVCFKNCVSKAYKLSNSSLQ